MDLTIFSIIQTESDFNNKRDQIKQMVLASDGIIQIHKDAMYRILDAPTLTWKKKISLIANQIIDPIKGNGGFVVLSYTDKITPVIVRVLRRVIIDNEHLMSIIDLDLSAQEYELISGLPHNIDNELMDSSLELKPLVIVGDQQSTPRDLVACALFICILIKIRENGNVKEFWPFVRSINWSNQAIGRWFFRLYSIVENPIFRVLLRIGATKLRMLHFIGENRIEDMLEIAGNTRDSFLSKPLLHWSNGVPFFCSAIDHAALSTACPKDCYALEITGPNGVMGQIARSEGNTQWHRVIGLGISQQMELRLPLTGLFSGEISIEIRSILSKMDFSAQIFLVLWHDDALISRYGSNGGLHQDAWRKLLPAGESLSLLYPSGWTANMDPACCADLADSGMRIARFDAGWDPPIQIRDECGVIWWNSADLHSPSKSLPMELRDIRATCVIDYRASEHVTAHLEIHPHAQLVQGVTINGEFKTLAALGKQGALRIGDNRMPLQTLWNGPSVKIKLAHNG